MANLIDNLTIAKALELLNDNKVISRYRDYSTLEKDTGRVIQRRIVNCFQFVKENDKYMFYEFDGFGIKKNEETKEISIDEMEKYIANHRAYKNDRSDGQWSYHTKKVPKKELNANINNEADMKHLVYEWLLGLNKDLVIIPEFSVGKRRADYMAFDKADTYLVEIKSEVDTLDRLEEQLKAYHHVGNYIYIAFHESKALKIKDITVPDNVGMLIVSNGKLKLVKKAKKNKIDKMVFESYVSYIEYFGCVSGLKHSTKFTKEQIIEFINITFTEKQRANFYYGVMRNRNEHESNKRKECWAKDDFKSALGKASLVGVNRLAPSGYNMLTLASFFNVPHEILFDYYTSIEQRFYKKYVDMEDVYIFGQDPAFVRYIYDKYDIRLFASNDLSFFEKALVVHKQVFKIWEEIKTYPASYVENSLNEAIASENKLLVFTVFSSYVKDLVLKQLSAKGVKKEAILMEKPIYRPDYKRMSKKCLEIGKKAIICHAKSQYGYGIEDHETEEHIHRTIDFKKTLKG